MSLIKPMPLDHLGKIYAKWETTPDGSLLSSAAYVATPNNAGSYDRSADHFIAIKGSTNAIPVLVCVTPPYRLLFEANKNRQWFSTPSVVMGPAIDISATHRVTVSNLAPTNAVTDFSAGDVVYDANSDRIFLVVDYPDYANRGLVLRGDNQWTITDMPRDTVQKIGTVSVGLVGQPTEL